MGSDANTDARPKRVLRYLTWALGLLAASSFALALIEVFPVSSGPPSRFASALLATTEFATLAHLSLCAGVGVVTLCVLGIVLKRRTQGAGLLSLALALSLASVAAAPASWQLALLARRASLRNIREHAVPILFGIAQFEKEQGRPPLVLEELVPAYLVRVPDTGLRGCPDFEYEPLDDRVSYATEAGGWELRVPCGGGMLNWDTYLYWPTGRYPRRTHGGWVERLDTWAYVHE